MEQRLWKENIKLEKEKENQYMIKMMEDISHALEKAKEDEIIKKK